VVPARPKTPQAELTYTARQTVDVRPLTADELDVVERTLARYPGKHRERLEGQRRGESVYLIAWDGKEPVGHLNLRLRGRKLPDRARRLEAAQIEDLRVARAHRRRGVARELMRRAAHEACAHGFSAVGLGVDIGNTPARRLYFAEGYEESGTGEFVVSYPYIDEEGYERQAHETCTYLVKRLS
jgi:ribosomal protein S18 acetylase RimI-like enzyme